MYKYIYIEREGCRHTYIHTYILQTYDISDGRTRSQTDIHTSIHFARSTHMQLGMHACTVYAHYLVHMCIYLKRHIPKCMHACLLTPAYQARNIHTSTMNSNMHLQPSFELFQTQAPKLRSLEKCGVELLRQGSGASPESWRRPAL